MTTAVECLVEQIMKHDKSFLEFYGAEIEQANTMFEQQIIDTWHNGYNNQSPMIDEENCGEQYYNETFKK